MRYENAEQQGSAGAGTSSYRNLASEAYQPGSSNSSNNFENQITNIMTEINTLVQDLTQNGVLSGSSGEAGATSGGNSSGELATTGASSSSEGAATNGNGANSEVAATNGSSVNSEVAATTGATPNTELAATTSTGASGECAQTPPDTTTTPPATDTTTTPPATDTTTTPPATDTTTTPPATTTDTTPPAYLMQAAQDTAKVDSLVDRGQGGQALTALVDATTAYDTINPDTATAYNQAIMGDLASTPTAGGTSGALVMDDLSANYIERHFSKLNSGGTIDPEQIYKIENNPSLYSPTDTNQVTEDLLANDATNFSMYRVNGGISNNDSENTVIGLNEHIAAQWNRAGQPT